MQYNETSNTCLINSNRAFPNGTVLIYEKCPDVYNSSRKYIFNCCLMITKNKLQGTKLKIFREWLEYYSSSTLLGPAIALNFLSFIVLTRSSKLIKYGKPMNFCMKFLCILDTLAIISNFVNEYFSIRNVIRKSDEKYLFNPIACKIIHSSTITFGISSTYILVFMNFRKLISIASPLKTKTESIAILRPNWTKAMCSLIVLMSFTYSCIYLSNIVYISKGNETSNCNFDTLHANYYNLSVFDSIFKTFIPLLFLLVCNTSIILLAAKERKKIRNLFNESKSIYKKNSTKNPKLDKIEKPNIENEDKLLILTKDDVKKSNKNDIALISKSIRRKRSKNYSKMSKKNFNFLSVLLLASSFEFILLNLPIAIVTLLDTEKRRGIVTLMNYGFNNMNSTLIVSKSQVISAFRLDYFIYTSFFLYDLNYIADFFFYFLSSAVFRKKLYLLFVCPEKKTPVLTRS